MATASEPRITCSVLRGITTKDIRVTADPPAIALGPVMVFLDDFAEVKAIGDKIARDHRVVTGALDHSRRAWNPKADA